MGGCWFLKQKFKLGQHCLKISNLPKEFKAEFKELLKAKQEKEVEIFDGDTILTCRFPSHEEKASALKWLCDYEFHGCHLLVQDPSTLLSGIGPSAFSVYVYNVPSRASVEDVWKFFKNCGSVQSIDLQKENSSAENAPITVRVMFDSPDCVTEAVALSGTELLKSSISVMACSDLSILVPNGAWVQCKCRDVKAFAKKFNADICMPSRSNNNLLTFPTQETYEKALSALEDSSKFQAKTAMLFKDNSKLLRLSNFPVQDDKDLDTELKAFLAELYIPSEIQYYEKAMYPRNTVIAAIIQCKQFLSADRAADLLQGEEFRGRPLVVHILSKFDYLFNNSVGVANLPSNASEEDLCTFFKDCGIIKNIAIARIPINTEAAEEADSERRYAKIAFSCEDDVAKALDQDGSTFLGTPVPVNVLERPLTIQLEVSDGPNLLAEMVTKFSPVCVGKVSSKIMFTCFSNADSHEKATSYLTKKGLCAVRTPLKTVWKRFKVSKEKEKPQKSKSRDRRKRKVNRPGKNPDEDEDVGVPSEEETEQEIPNKSDSLEQEATQVEPRRKKMKPGCTENGEVDVGPPSKKIKEWREADESASTERSEAVIGVSSKKSKKQVEVNEFISADNDNAKVDLSLKKIKKKRKDKNFSSA